MSELWKQVTDNIDERFTDEAAEYFAKHSDSELLQESEGSNDAKVISLKYESSEKKHSKAKIIAVIGAAAAAVMLCVFGGIHLMRGENKLLPDDTPTSEASDTLETDETNEAIDIVEQPKINAVEAELILTDTIRDQDIIHQAGFDVPYEHFYDEEAIRKAAEYVNSLPDTDEKQQLIEQNYFNASLDVSYIGSDTADWICAINYDLCYYEGIIEPCYSRVFYVKDGLITENVFEADRASTVTRDGDYVYISKGSDGLFMLNTDTMAIQAITSDSAQFWSHNEDYVLFRNGMNSTLQVYDRESGEIIPTDIYRGQFDAGTTEAVLLDDRIRCYEQTDKTLYDIMLPSGEIQALEMSYEEAFSVNSGYDVQRDTLTHQYPEHSIIITDLSTGLTETLYMDDFSDTLYNKQRCNVGNPDVYDGVVYIPVYESDSADKIYIAYDIKTGSAMYFVPDTITNFYYDGVNLIGWSYEPYEWSDALTYVKYSKLTLKPVYSETESSEWASMELYNGDDEAALEFKNTLSEAAAQQEQKFFDGIMNGASPEEVESYHELIESGELGYQPVAYYVKADDGAEFWLKQYALKMSNGYAFSEIYIRNGDEFTFVCKLDSLDHYITPVCSGDYLYYSQYSGIIGRISTSGEVQQVYDARVAAPEDALDGLSYMELSLITQGMSGKDDTLYIGYEYMYYSHSVGDHLFCQADIQMNTDNELLKHDVSGLGYEIVDGEALPFSIARGEHDHLEASWHDDVLLQRGAEKLSDAIKLYQIKENAGVARSLESYDDIQALYNSTFAGTMYNYSGHYYSADTPSAAPWYTDDDRLKESLWSSIDANAGLDHAQSDISALHEYWTTIEGVIDSGDNYVDYQLCTICKNTSKSIDAAKVPYYYEHSVMRLEKINGEWKITQLRTRLGNEYGTAQLEELNELGYTVSDESYSYTEILCGLLREDGHDVLGTSVEDFDFDGTAELFILAEKNDSKTIRVYEQQSYGWELVELISDEALNALNTAQFIRYEEDEERTYQAMGNNRSILNIRFVPNDDIYDNNRGEYVVEKLGTLLYKTPIEYPGVLGVLFERYPEIKPDPQEFAESLADSLMRALSDGNKDYERTFDVLDWEIKNVEVTPVSEAPYFYNITDEERALENAWIVEPEVRFTYDGKVSGKRGNADEWYEGLGADNIGFLMWQEGDTFFLRSRWLNCGTEQLMTDDELSAFLDENLQPALDIINLIYFSGDNARAAGMKQIEESLYEVAPDFPYSSVDEIKAEAAKYFTEDAVGQLNIGFWFPVVDGKLCAQTFNKGLSCSGYTAENAEILSQYNFAPYSKVVFKLKMTDWIIKNQYSEDGYRVVTLVYDSVKGKWLFSDKLI